MKDKRQKFIVSENEQGAFDIVHQNGGWSSVVARNNPDAVNALLTAERLASGAGLDESHVTTEFKVENRQ